MISDKITYNRGENRSKGILMPLFSLPSKYGIGCVSEEAFRFVDMLAETGHAFWQVLPLNPTGCGDSPYQPLSSFAGNAYYIDPRGLIRQGLLSESEADGYRFGSDPECVDYGALYGERLDMLRIAYERFAEGGENDAFARFCGEHRAWLDDYALFMALREKYGREMSWDAWPDAVRLRHADALGEEKLAAAETIGFYKWTQFEFFRQWSELRKYANDSGVKIIGDMPIYVSYDSADCWARPEQFLLDDDLRPVLVAGVPPDAFASEGQLWGNPLYNWEKMKSDGYSWWLSRVRQGFLMYDVIRLDHFRGYEAYYAVPAGAENAAHGEWKKGPGIEPFTRVERGSFIAEDLGFLTDGVRELLEASGFPGTKVLQFGFDGDPGNIYLPENYPENCVVYTGTHDNDTTAGWFAGLEGGERERVLDYLEMGPAGTSDITGEVCDALIEKALTSRAVLSVIPMQDYLHLGSGSRVNVPGTVGGNWCWRMKEIRLPEGS